MKTVAFRMCACGKRGFVDELDADKALGRARAKRRRQMDGRASRRGVVTMESRTYKCEIGDLFHTTSQSRREYNERAAAPALTWQQFLATQGQVAA